MANNIIFEDGDQLSVICTAPTTPAAGGPVIFGDVPGLALTDEAGGGNATGYTTVKFSGVADVSVKGVDSNGNSAVAAGDSIYYHDGDTPKLSKKATSGVRWGTAMEAVSSGATDTIRVRIGK